MSLAVFSKRPNPETETPQNGNKRSIHNETPKNPLFTKTNVYEETFPSHALVFAFCAADAQVTTSGMNGTVTDAAGQPLAGATVIAVHTPSGTQYGAVTDKNGGYNLQGLAHGEVPTR